MTSRGERLVSLDVFRGLTIAGMLLVNNPGSWDSIYPPLEHAAWHGWTPTDLIFPFFLFIVGITTELSLQSRRAKGASDRALTGKIIERGGLIFLIGLLLSAFPFYQWGAIPGNADPSVVDRVVYRIETLRIMGVLQRIGIAYILSALITLRSTLRTQFVVLAGILMGYWAIMTLVVVPDSGLAGRFLLDNPSGQLGAWLDRTLLGTQHLWSGSKTWDPEGLLSTIPAVGTCMLGTFAGRWLRLTDRSLDERLSAMLAVGAILMMLGLVWNWWFPINKNLWTSSYVVFTGGMAAVTLGICMWIIDVRRIQWWVEPWVVYGINPLTAYAGSWVMARLTVSVISVSRADGSTVSLQGAVYEALFSSWLSPKLASFMYAAAFVTLWYLLLRILWKRGIVFRV